MTSFRKNPFFKTVSDICGVLACW